MKRFLKDIFISSSSLVVHPGSLVLLICVALLCLPIDIASAQQGSKQKKEQLEQQMKKLRKEIADMEKQLELTSHKKKENLEQVAMLKEKIRKRESLISNYSHQIDDLEEDISDTKKDIEAESEQVTQMKKDYAAMLRKTYSNLSLRNEYAFVLSASSFNEAIARYNYLKRISEYRRTQAEAIDQSIHDLVDKKTDLESSKKKKLMLLEAQSQQKEKLEGEKEQTDKMIAQLSEKEKKIHKYVEEKNKAVQAMNAKIQKIIEEEIKQARKKAEQAAARKKAAEEKAKHNTGTTTTTAHTTTKSEPVLMSPHDEELTKDFAGNKGKLPWPVAKGSIVSYFGKHEHPTLKGVFIENNGLDIKAADGASGRSIFNGSVISVFTLPTTQTCIIIKHGEYFSVYSNITVASVKANETVSTKQSLGMLSTDRSDSQTKIHLEIWRGKDKLNPADWLSR